MHLLFLSFLQKSPFVRFLNAMGSIYITSITSHHPPKVSLENSFRVGVVSESHPFQLIVVLLDVVGIQVFPIPIRNHPAVLVANRSTAFQALAVLVDPPSAAVVLEGFGCDHPQKG